MKETDRPSIIWVLFDDPRVGRTTVRESTENCTTQTFVQNGHLYLMYSEHL